jgi:hypothetical protein
MSDYRPISVLPALSKAIETIIRRQINAFLMDRGLPVRFSHSSQHLKIINDLLIATDERIVSLLVLLDFSKAFDSVNHYLLVRSVWLCRTSAIVVKVGRRMVLYQLFQDFCQNRVAKNQKSNFELAFTLRATACKICKSKILTIFYWAETRTKFYLVYIKSTN